MSMERPHGTKLALHFHTLTKRGSSGAIRAAILIGWLTVIFAVAGPGSAQAQACRPGDQAQPDGGCAYDPTKRSVCQAGDRVLPDGTCVRPGGGVTYQSRCNLGEQTLQNPLRCVYRPPVRPGQEPVSCLAGERLLSNGKCGGGTCRPGEQSQSDGGCAYDPAKRSVCLQGDRIMPDGTCVHPGGGVTYQNACNPGEQTMQNPLRCVYMAAAIQRAPSGCLWGEQLLADGRCGAMASVGCKVGEQILMEAHERQFGPGLKGMCAYRVELEGGNNTALTITCKPGERKLITPALCAYTPAMVMRSTGYGPYQPRRR